MYFSFDFVFSDVLISSLKAVKPLDFDTSKFSPLDACVISDVMRLTLMSSDDATPATAAPTATSSRKTSVDQLPASDDVADEAGAIERKLDDDIKRVLEQEQTCGGDTTQSDDEDDAQEERRDHNADKRGTTVDPADVTIDDVTATKPSDARDGTVRKVSVFHI